MKIISKKEAKEKGSLHYYTGKPCKYGHYAKRLVSTGKCGECQRLYHAQYVKKWQKDNKEKVNEGTRRWRENNPAQAKKTHKKYYNKNKDKKLQNNKAWRRENKHKVIQYNADRRAQILKASVSWGDKDAIALIYEEAVNLSNCTGIPHQVDHIVPLVNDMVCGLHCEDNLQILKASQNQSKGNKFLSSGN